MHILKLVRVVVVNPNPDTDKKNPVTFKKCTVQMLKNKIDFEYPRAMSLELEGDK